MYMQTVCLIGRPNVGKSTLFNRLIGEAKSIIMDTPGITRDRIYGNVTYKDKKFLLIDTGGIDLGQGDFNKDIKMQAQLAIDESDCIVFIVDGRYELNQNDYEIRNMLIKSGKRVIVAVNKLDNSKLEQENIYNYYELGFPIVLPISGTHNLGIDDLLDEITKEMADDIAPVNDNLKFSIIGRPNVGKSSLINALLGANRAIVSDVSGTTRDAVDTDFRYNGEVMTVIDTAGMRKKGKIYENIEKYSMIRSLKAIERSDVCCVVINAEEGIIEHDKHIVSYAINAGKAVVLVVNKWDTIKDFDTALKDWKQKIKNEFQFIPYVKTVFLSAKTKKRVSMLLPAIIEAYNNSVKEVPTNVLNDVITEAYNLHEAPSYKGKRLKIYFTHQTGSKPPKITFEVNNKGLVHFSYESYLENKIREAFDFTGTPIILQFKNRSEK